MPKLKNILKSAAAEVLHKKNGATLDACIKLLATHNIQLRESGKIDNAILPLSEADIRAKNLDLGAFAAQGDTVEQCVKKFSEHSLVKYEGPTNIIDAAEEALHKATNTLTDEL